MRAELSPYWVPKAGNAADEYEDACEPRRESVRTGTRVRAAVADGASEAMLSGAWAATLVRAFCRSRSLRARSILTAALDQWDDWLATYLDEREREGRPVQWFEEPGLERGSFATVLGLLAVESGRWAALALGDSCLFHVRDGELVKAFPVEDPADFGTSPMLVPTRPKDLDTVVDRMTVASGEWVDGDRFYLATDALACWFLEETDRGAKPWEELDGNADRFSDWVDDRRAGGDLKNDDVTLVRLALA